MGWDRVSLGNSFCPTPQAQTAVIGKFAFRLFTHYGVSWQAPICDIFCLCGAAAFAREVRILGSFHLGVEELAEDLVRLFS
jgi:hypothetical protein